MEMAISLPVHVCYLSIVLTTIYCCLSTAKHCVELLQELLLDVVLTPTHQYGCNFIVAPKYIHTLPS